MNPFQPHQYFPRDSRHAFGHRFQVDPEPASIWPFLLVLTIILAVVGTVLL